MSRNHKPAPINEWKTTLLLTILCVSVSVATQQSGGADQMRPVPRAASRVLNEPESVWVEFVELGLKNKPLNLGQGFPDFAAPSYLLESLRNASQEPAMNQYTRSFGHPRLVAALARYYSRAGPFPELTSGHAPAQDQVLVTVGAYEALYCAIMAFVEPGDQVLIVEPAFDAYKPMVELAQGRAVFVALERVETGEKTALSSAHYRLPMGELARLASESNGRMKMLVLNNPNNPLGKAYSRSELEEVAQFARQHNLIVLADEVYGQLQLEEQSEHVSIGSLARMWPRTITVGSAGKSFSVTGWKVGWALGPPELIRFLQLVHQTTLYTVATPLQEAIARALERETGLVLANDTSAYWPELRGELRRKRDRLGRLLAGAGLEPIVPQAGYFMLAHFEGFARRLQFNDTAGQEQHLFAGCSMGAGGENAECGRSNATDFRFARWLSTKHKLQVIPGSAFYGTARSESGPRREEQIRRQEKAIKNLKQSNDLVRFCFIKSDFLLDQLESLLKRIVAPSGAAISPQLAAILGPIGAN